MGLLGKRRRVKILAKPVTSTSAGEFRDYLRPIQPFRGGGGGKSVQNLLQLHLDTGLSRKVTHMQFLGNKSIQTWGGGHFAIALHQG